MKPFGTRFIVFVAILLIAAQLLAACAPASAPAHDRGIVFPLSRSQGNEESVSMQMDPLNKSASKIEELAFRQAVRKLWEDHITWTRVYIISALAGLPDADAAAGRLLQNQADIGNAIKPFYGDEAGDQLTGLLREHILIAAELLAAAKSGDTAAFQDANKRWVENADQIAAFLHSANPDNWPLEDMQTMMRSHLDLTLEEATARLNGDWPADVAAYDRVHDEILSMADMLAEGIIAQFPKQFK